MGEDDLLRWFRQLDRRLNAIEARLVAIEHNMDGVLACVQSHGSRLAVVERVRLTPVPAAGEDSWSDD